MNSKNDQVEAIKEVCNIILDKARDVGSLMLVAQIDKVSINMLIGSKDNNVDTLLTMRKQAPQLFELFHDIMQASNDPEYIESPELSLIERLRRYCRTPLEFTRVKHKIIESFMEAEVPLPPSISEAENVDELSISVESNTAIFKMVASELN